MSTSKEFGSKVVKKLKARKERAAKKEQRKPVEPTEANLKAAREAATVLEYSVPKIRKALNATWSEAVAIRHALLKPDKAKS
jgi:hypothetical protein